MTDLPLTKVPIVDYGREESAMARYREEGIQRAQELGNRGPLRFDRRGKLDASILDAYTRCGFYIFENVISTEELADLRADVAEILKRAPATKDAKVDRQGRPALAAECRGLNFVWVKPLSDPVGGTDASNGRHPAKMIEPVPPAEAPDEVIQIVMGNLQFSEACLRLYGHPALLAVAAEINGDDFTPFCETLWIKHPGLGSSVAWHQDGWTHWDDPDLDDGTHGFNFMAQFYETTAANGLWVLPGSHRQGKVDIKRLVEETGSDRLPDAVPMLCRAGDVAICNRQAVHGSFANTSADIRVTMTFGFHRRRWILGVRSGGVHNEPAVYDQQRIRERARMIAYAIDARRQRFPEETPYEYEPLVSDQEAYRWTPAARADIHDYNLQDLGI